MKYFEPISQESIIDDINTLANSTNESYSNKRKIKNINEALDMYWFYAAESAPQFTFDDTGKSSSPLETQNLEIGKNDYKMTAFTNEVLQILRVSVLDSDGTERDLFYQSFENILEFNENYSTDSNDRGTPDRWTKFGDFIYVSPTPDYAKTSGLRVYVSRELSKLTYTSFVVTIATPGVVTATAHGLSNNDGLLLMTDNALPTGLTADTTIYYVSAKTDDTFELELTLSSVGGSGIDTTGSQAGTHNFVKVTGEPGIPVIHHDYLSRYAAYKFMDTSHPKFAKLREELAKDKLDIQDYWEKTIRPAKTIIRTKGSLRYFR